MRPGHLEPRVVLVSKLSFISSGQITICLPPKAGKNLSDASRREEVDESGRSLALLSAPPGASGGASRVERIEEAV